jgi:hypothetical protein
MLDKNFIIKFADEIITKYQLVTALNKKFEDDFLK